MTDRKTHANPLLRALDFLFVLRPLILLPAWSMYLIGAGEGRNAWIPFRASMPSSTALFSLTAILVAAYLLNQIFDRDSDEKNNKCLFLARGVFRERTLIVLAIVSFVLASVTYRNAASTERPLLLSALVIGLFYSLPPVRLCARPALDMLANAIGYGGIAFALGFVTFQPSISEAALGSIPYVLLVAATFLHTAILDIAGDRAVGKITTAVWMGAMASRLAAIVHVAGVGFALVTSSWIAAIITIVALPFTIIAAVRRDRASSLLVVSAHTFLVTMAAVVLWPGYLIVTIPLIALSRFYHKKRFGITYPGLPRAASKQA